MGNWKFSQAYALDLKKKYSIGAENNQDIPTKSDIINDFINKSQLSPTAFINSTTASAKEDTSSEI